MQQWIRATLADSEGQPRAAHCCSALATGRTSDDFRQLYFNSKTRFRRISRSNTDFVQVFRRHESRVGLVGQWPAC
jgi:hypothetical protein